MSSRSICRARRLVWILGVAIGLLPRTGEAQNPGGHWQFEEGSGNTTADATAAGNDGQLVNMDDTAWVAGRVGDFALHFDGVDDYVAIDNPESFNFLTDFTWTAWIRTDGPGANGAIISKSPLDEWTFGSKALFIGSEGDREAGHLTFDVGWIGALVSNERVDDGLGHHVALTVEFNTFANLDSAQLYIDGKPDAFLDDWDIDTAEVPKELGEEDPAAEGPLKIGRGSDFFPCEEVGPCSFLGVIDDVRIFNEALSAEEIAEIVAADVDCSDPADTHCNGMTVVGPPGDLAGTWTVTVNATDEGGDTIAYELIAESGAGQTITRTQLDNNVFEIRLRQGTWTINVTVDDQPLCPDKAPDNTCSEGPFDVGAPPEEQTGQWCLSEATGLDAADSAGGNDALLVDMDPDVAWVMGPRGEGDAALKFDGVDDVLLMNNPDAFFFHEDYTWSAWIKTSGDGTILAWSPHNDEWNMGSQALFVRGGLLTMDVGWVDAFQSIEPVDDSEWHHVAVTVEFNIDGVSEFTQFYIDGMPDASNTWDMEEAGIPLDATFHAGIASLDFPEPSRFTGVIDDIRTWNFALSEDEIIEVFEGQGGDCPAANVDCPAEGEAEHGDTHCMGITVEGPEGNVAGTWTVTVNGTDETGDDITYSVVAERADPPGRVVQEQAGDNVFEIRLSPGNWTIGASVDDDGLCGDLANNADCPEESVEVARGEGQLIGHWCFDDGLGLVATDAVETSDADLVNMDEDAWVEGPLGGGDSALAFDGFDDYVIVRDSELFDIHFGDHTWALWFRTADIGLDGGMMQKGPTDVDWDDKDHRGGRSFEIRNGVLGVDVGWVGFLAGGESGIDVSDGNWHHAAMTVEMDANGDGDATRLYVDGKLDGMRDDWDIATQIPNVTGDLKFGWVGIFEDAPAPYFTGDLDDIRVYNFALTGEEIFEIIENPEEGCGGEPPPVTFIRGDTDTNGRMELTDAIGIFNFLFITGVAPPCFDSADADDNGTIELTDGIRILNVLFLGFGVIPDPGFLNCGPDPTVDQLGACVHEGCP